MMSPQSSSGTSTESCQLCCTKNGAALAFVSGTSCCIVQDGEATATLSADRTGIFFETHDFSIDSDDYKVEAYIKLCGEEEQAWTDFGGHYRSPVLGRNLAVDGEICVDLRFVVCGPTGSQTGDAPSSEVKVPTTILVQPILGED